MIDIKSWLESLGLPQYHGAFVENDIDGEVLPELTDIDLEKLGVSLGHRKKMLKAIARDHPQASSKAEFRYLTVLFCDLIGSTALTTELGAEEMRAVNRRCQDIWKAAVDRFDGYIARYMGDAVLVYFGYPVSHEDAAERAVRAGLEIVDRMRSLEVESLSTETAALQVRIGIATGQVVVEQIGEGASMEKAAVGEAPNLAARLQSLARPNTVVIADKTREIVADTFLYRELDKPVLKGISGDTKVWEILRVADAPSRFAAAQRRPLGSFVGRHDELTLMLSRWRQAMEGEGQVVVLSGAAGIGKSRILEVLLERIGTADVYLSRLYCSPYHTQSVLFPVLEAFKREAKLSPEDSTETRREKLDRLLTGEFDLSGNQLNVIRSLVTPESHESGPATDLLPQEQMVLFRGALIETTLKWSTRLPVLIVLEDAHWIDPSTRTLVDMLVEQVQDARVLLVIASRPENCPDYGQAHVTKLSLNRLDRNDTTALINDISRDKDLPPDVIDNIRRKCEGFPLYVEELTRMVLEVRDDAASGGRLSVPDTLKSSLLARLDRLGDAKNIAQVASVVGDEITAHIIAESCDVGHSDVERGLEQLMHHDVLYRQTSVGVDHYEFRHALLKDAAYESLLKADRVRIHHKTADYLRGEAAEKPGIHLELVAYHYFEAGETDLAFECWLRTGQEALESGATMEAVAIFGKALECMPRHDPECPDRRILGDLYALHMGRGKALNAAVGAASMEAHEAFRRAQAIGEQVGNVEWMVDALDYEFGFTFNAGSLAESVRPAESMIRIGEETGNLTALISGYQGLGMVRFAQGEFATARDVLEKGLEHRNRDVPGVNCYPSMTMTYLSYVLFVLGEPDEARSMCSEALESAREESVRSTATALSNCCYTWQFLDEPEMIAAYADELVELAEEKGMYMFRNRGLFFKNLAQARLQRDTNSLRAIVDAVDTLLDSGEEIETPFLLGLIADLQLSFGSPEDAFETLARAVSIAEKNGERSYLAELLRLNGIAMLATYPGEPARAAGSFDEALNVARAQGARCWEQRAAQSRREALST